MLTFAEYTHIHETVTYEDYCYALDNEITERVSASVVLSDLKAHLMSIADDFKMSYLELANALKEKSVFALLKAFGFSLKKMAAATYKGITSLNQILMSVVTQMADTGDLAKLQRGSMTADEFVAKYPAMKRITGPMVAAFLIYQWLNMSFSGDFKQDFDITAVLEALRGNYTFEDVLASPLGFKSMVQLMTGLSIGITFPWGMLLPANLALALLYTVALRTRNRRLMVKTRKAIRKAQPTAGGGSTTRYV